MQDRHDDVADQFETGSDTSTSPESESTCTVLTESHTKNVKSFSDLKEVVASSVTEFVENKASEVEEILDTVTDVFDTLDDIFDSLRT